MSTTVVFPVQFQSEDSDLERTTSAQSSHTTTSSRGALSTNAHSASSANTTLVTPHQHPSFDDDRSDHDLDDMYAEADAARIRMGKLGTRSMQSVKPTKGRERSMTDAKKCVIFGSETDSRPEISPLALPPPLPTMSTIPKSAGAKPSKSTSSFAAFLRKLTGKGPKKQKESPVQQSVPIIRPPVTRQGTAPTPTTIRPVPARQISVPHHPTQSLVQSQPISSAPTAIAIPETVDPCNIPLPPSPSNDASLIDFSTPLPIPSQNSRQQNQTQSFEGFDIAEEQELEEEDQVRPLRSLRIIVNKDQRDLSPDSAPLRSGSSVDTNIQTPTSYSYGSDSEGSPEKSGLRVEPSSPSKAAALDRKGSKWRRSVMGVSKVSTSSDWKSIADPLAKC